MTSGGDARARAFLRRLFACERGDFSHARAGAHGHSRGGSDERRRRNRAGVSSRDAWWSLRDHINLQGTNPLIGPNDEHFGVRFPGYDAGVLEAVPRVCAGKKRSVSDMQLFEGVYAGLTGPSYETPAEIRYLRTIGADLVGMSTVPEVIAAAHLGIRVLGISCVTNMAAGILDQPITTEEVIETGERVKGQFAALLSAVIPRIDADLVVAAQNESRKPQAGAKAVAVKPPHRGRC